jgi:cell division septation protein DedD
VPRGFPPNFRHQIVADFDRLIDERLGAAVPAAKRAGAAAVQNQFWDEHGPDVDLLRDHAISQEQFAERTHRSMARLAESFGRLFTPAEYERLMGAPAGADPFPVLFHSREEQPGLPFHAELSHPTPLAEPASSITPRPAPNAVRAPAASDEAPPPTPTHPPASASHMSP